MGGSNGVSDNSNFLASFSSIKFCSAPESTSAGHVKVSLLVTMVTDINNRGLVVLKVLPIRIPGLTSGPVRLGGPGKQQCNDQASHSTGSPQPKNAVPFLPVKAGSVRFAWVRAGEAMENVRTQPRVGTTKRETWGAIRVLKA